MDAFPAVFPLKGLRVAVAGDGEAAEAKARLFAGAPCSLVRVAPDRAGEPDSYAGVRLVFIACARAEAAAAAARAAGALVNVVDRPELCDFTTPAIVDRGAVVGAIATGGAAPVLAAELRRELEARWPPALGAVAELLAALRDEVRAARPQAADRRAWLRALLESEAAGLALAGEREAALAAARAQLAKPGALGRLERLEPAAEPDLLSLRALRALSQADRLVLAPGVDPALLRLARRDAPVQALDAVSAVEISVWLRAGERIVCIGSAQALQALGPMPTLPAAQT